MSQHSPWPEPMMSMMRRALELAAQGRGSVEPNPMVGAVILDASGQIVGEGWHERFGEAHAEINALNQAGARARGGKLFVTLEPCCHHGKTPPCTDALLARGLKTVVVAMPDPFPAVAGQGIQLLKDAGLEVIQGVMVEEACYLNRAYLCRVSLKRPWVTAKWAMSCDGKMASRSGSSKWISSEQSRRIVHQLRGEVDVLAVGAGTLRQDDPRLTARPTGQRTPRRLIFSRSGALPTECQLLRTTAEAPIIIFTENEEHPSLDVWRNQGVIIHKILTLKQGLEWLTEQYQATHLLLEGGADLLGAFHDADLIDEVSIFIAPILLGGSRAAVLGEGVTEVQSALPLDHLQVQHLGPDTWIRGVVRRNQVHHG